MVDLKETMQYFVPILYVEVLKSAIKVLLISNLTFNCDFQQIRNLLRSMSVKIGVPQGSIIGLLQMLKPP